MWVDVGATRLRSPSLLFVRRYEWLALRGTLALPLLSAVSSEHSEQHYLFHQYEIWIWNLPAIFCNAADLMSVPLVSVLHPSSSSDDTNDWLYVERWRLPLLCPQNTPNNIIYCTNINMESACNLLQCCCCCCNLRCCCFHGQNFHVISYKTPITSVIFDRFSITTLVLQNQKPPWNWSCCSKSSAMLLPQSSALLLPCGKNFPVISYKTPITSVIFIDSELSTWITLVPQNRNHHWLIKSINILISHFTITKSKTRLVLPYWCVRFTNIKPTVIHSTL